MKKVPSPNFNARPDGVPVDMLVLHYTGMPTAKDALERMTDPAAEVSAHYMVDEDGSILQLVEEEKRAWHAGVSSWREFEGLNDSSIGIEIVNPGYEFGYRRFPEQQVDSVIALAKEIVARHDIPHRNVVGHSDIAPDRKEDPGELFPWRKLAEAGVGLWFEPSVFPADGAGLRRGDEGVSVQAMQAALKHFGYGIVVDGVYGKRTFKVVSVFQQHYIQRGIDGLWRPYEQAVLDGLLRKL